MVPGASDLDAERELHKLKRVIGGLFSKGDYTGALEAAQRLKDTVSQSIGNDNAIFASSLNNVALMHKMLGENEVALEHYTKALHIYQDVVGKEHTSYASTLSNMGILYRTMAEKASGMDRLQLLERAEEALRDSLDTKRKISGNEDKDTISTAMNLAMVWRVMEPQGAGPKSKSCEEELRRCLTRVGNTSATMMS